MSDALKLFVLDTSVILYSAASLHSFADNGVVIPYVVLEELDKFKTREGPVGVNARQAARKLNDLRKQGSLSDGVTVNEAGGTLRVELDFITQLHPSLDVSVNDDRILNVCLGLQKDNVCVVLVTNDINLAVRADVIGVAAQAFDSDAPITSVSEMYLGFSSEKVPSDVIDGIYSRTAVMGHTLEEEHNANEYLTLESDSNAGKTALVRHTSPTSPLSLVKTRLAWGLQPRNREQHFAMDALMDPSISLVSLVGLAGSGKTLLSLACGLEMVQDLQLYDRLVVSRPVQSMGADMGYLPGGLDEKLDPWMGPVKDAVSFLSRNKDPGNDVYQHMLDTGMLEVEPLSYIRGRSMPRTLFILDEAQNISRNEIKTIISRMGEGSKIIITGDVMQIDNPYLDSMNNGLSIVVEKFKPYAFAAHVTLTRGERSELATIASEIL